MSTPLLYAYERLVRRRILLGGGLSKYRTVAGRRIHYYEIAGRGEGPPLLLLHGLGGSAGSFVRIMFALRKKWSRIYVPNLPGHGLSRLEAHEAPLTVRGHGEVAFAFLQEVIGEPVAIIGHSMGGALALGIAIEKNADIRAVGLISPAGAPVTHDHLAGLRRRFAPRSAWEAMSFLRDLTHKPMPAAFLAARDVGEMLRSRAIQHILTEMSPAERLDDGGMRGLQMPVLLIWGAQERVLPGGSFEYLRSHLPPHARVELFDRCGHMPPIEHPVRTVRLINELADAIARDRKQQRSAA